jgi:hypothetical protein
MKLGNDTRSGTFNLDRNFICLDVGHCLVELDPLSFFFHELSNGPLIDGVGKERQGDGFS